MMSPFYCHLFFNLKTSPKGTLSLGLSVLGIPNGFLTGLPCQPPLSVLSSWVYDVRLLYTPITCYSLFPLTCWILRLTQNCGHGYCTSPSGPYRRVGDGPFGRSVCSISISFLCGTVSDMEFTPFKRGQSRLANLQF